jgi:protein brassinosteroid insensitive 1
VTELPLALPSNPAGSGTCKFPGAEYVGGRLTLLSLAGVLLNANFCAVVAMLLQLAALMELSLRGANGAVVVPGRCGPKPRTLDLSGNADLQASVAAGT